MTTLKCLDQNLEAFYKDLCHKTDKPDQVITSPSHKRDVQDSQVPESLSTLLIRRDVHGHLETSALNEVYDLGVEEYTKGHIKAALSIFLTFRKEVAFDSIAVSQEKQLSSMFYTLGCYIVLSEWASACDLVIRTSEVLDSLQSSRGRNKSGGLYTQLVNWMMLPLFLSPDSSSLSSLLISEQYVSVVCRSAPQLKELLAVNLVLCTNVPSWKQRVTAERLLNDNPDDSSPIYKLARCIFLGFGFEKVADALQLIKDVTNVVKQDSLACHKAELFGRQARTKFLLCLLKTQTHVSWSDAMSIVTEIDLPNVEVVRNKYVMLKSDHLDSFSLPRVKSCVESSTAQTLQSPKTLQLA